MFSLDLSQRLLELVAIESPTAAEEEIASQVGSWAEISFGSDRVKSWRNGLLVTPRLREGRPLVALVGHLDTVPGVEGLAPELKDDLIFGRGSVDMKAGVAIAMSLLEEEHEVDVLGVFYDREEGPISDNGLLPLLNLWQGKKPDFALVLEPTDNTVQAGCLGGFHATVTVAGQACHSARPWKGSNAILNSIPLLQKVEQFGVQEQDVAGLKFTEVMSLTKVETDNANNVIPGSVKFNLNFRFAPNRTVENAKDFLMNYIGDLATVTIRDTAPPGEVVLTHPMLSPWVEKHNLVVEPKQAWTDVAQLTSIGIPAVNFGPGDPGRCHQDDEHIPISSLEACMGYVRDFLNS